MDSREHIPVLAAELVAAVEPDTARYVVDGTFGAGGHAALIASRLPDGATYHAIDRDPGARTYLSAVREAAGDAVTVELVHSPFADEFERLAGAGVSADAVILDLGVSSMQIDQQARGFSYSRDAPLDMRMDTSAEHTAADVVADADESALRELLRAGGAEQEARVVARGIVRAREQAPIRTTGELVAVIEDAVPQPLRKRRRGHPAKRVFQALRIAVNDELGQLRRALDAGFELLAPGGRFAVISFHSLEDRLVKQRFRDLCIECTCPPRQPICTCGGLAQAEVVGPRQTAASDAELAANPRAASARLRAIRRLR